MTILNEIHVNSALADTLAGIGWVAAVIFLTIGLIMIVEKFYYIGVCILIFCIPSVYLIWHANIKMPKVTQYEVILDETYPVSKLFSKYEIIEQRGKIFVIKEKE